MHARYILLIAAALGAAAWALSAQSFDYELGIIYYLPSNPDLAREAEGIEHQLLTERNTELTACSLSRDDKAECERRAEVAFRRGIASIPGSHFELDYQKPGGGSGYDLFALSANEATSRNLDQNFLHVEAGEWFYFGLHMDLPNCRILRDRDSSPLEQPLSPGFEKAACDLIRSNASVYGFLRGMLWSGGKQLSDADYDEFDFLLNHLADIDDRGPDGTEEPLLFWAAESNNPSVVRLLLQHGANPNFQDKTETTPLVEAACQSGDTSANAVRELLDHGADPNVRPTDSRGWTALDCAVSNQSVESATLLLGHGADPNTGLTADGRTALEISLSKDSTAMTALLLDHGADLTRTSKSGDPPLWKAVSWAKPGQVELLLNHGANPNLLDRTGWPLLDHAATNGGDSGIAVLRQLLAHGGNPNIASVEASNPEIDGVTPLMTAAEAGLTGNMDVLLSSGAKIDEHNDSQGSALTRAACGGQTEVVEFLLAHQASPGFHDSKGRTPLICAAALRPDEEERQAASEKQKTASDAGTAAPAAASDSATDNSEAAMARAGKRLEPIIATMIERGADVNAQDKDGKSALINACANFFPGVVQLLLANHADPNARDANGDTPLILAADDQQENVRLLLAAGANPSASNKSGDTPLMSAMHMANLESARMLIQAGADVNAADSNGLTALMGALQSDTEDADRLQIARLILEHGGRADAADIDGNTALMDFVQNAGDTQSALIDLLLRHGANPLHKNKAGKTAVDLARDSGDAELASTLLAHARN